MSDLNDDLSAAFEMIDSQQGLKDADGQIVDIRGSFLGETPGIIGATNFFSGEVTKMLRRGYRLRAGAAPFADSLDAFEKVKALVEKDLINVCIRAFSNGVLVGQGSCSPVKKFNFFDRMDDVFGSEAFQTESDTFSISVKSDYECMESFERYFAGAALYFGSASGYNLADGEGLNKIWDVFFIATKSVCVALYTAGYHVGKKWNEKDVLAGILSATEATDEG